MRRSIKTTLATLAGAAMALPAFGADHKEAPLISADPSADINDIYVFASPDDPSKTVLAMTVNPFSAPAEAVNFNFNDAVLYGFHSDVDGDGASDNSVFVIFSGTGSSQTFRVFLPDGSTLDGAVTAPTEEPTPNAPVIADNGVVRAFAGPRDDPFFFDFVGFNRLLSGTGGFSGTDSFAGFNVSAIVVELPTSLLGGSDGILGIWGTTSRRGLERHRAPRRSLDEVKEGFDFDTFIPVPFSGIVQIERMGNPAVSTVLIPAPLKDLFNATRPRFDGDFTPTIVASLNAIASGFNVFPDVPTLASVAVTGGDTLKYDPSNPNTAFPFGRAPADDVIDTLLSLILRDADGNPVFPAGDQVDANDVPFPGTFPFLAPPQQPL